MQIASCRTSAIFLNTKGNITHTNVYDFAEAEIEINQKIRCQIKVSFKENYQNKTIIEGQKGKLIINSPWLPEKQTNLEISQGSSYYKKIVNSDLSLYANQIEKVSDNFEKNKKDDKFLVNNFYTNFENWFNKKLHYDLIKNLY